MSVNNGGDAFPKIKKIYPLDGRDPVTYDGSSGMSLRDYFAAKAMQGMLSRDSSGGGWCPNGSNGNGVERVARYAYEYADAMIQARDVQ